MSLTFDLTIIFILFLLSGFFASAEASFFSLTDLHLHKMKSDRYPFLHFVTRLLRNPRRLLITIVIGNEAVNIGISILAASFFISLLGANGQWVAIIFTSGVLLIVGEAIPKTFGVTYPMPISSVVSPVLFAFSRLESPIVTALEKLSDFILRRYGDNRGKDAETLMEEEFKTLIDAGSREGVVNESQKELINRIFALGDKPVTEIMVPRVDMFCLSATLSVEEIVKAVVKAQHERIPVYSGDRDDIVGILFARDLLNAALQSRTTGSIEKLLRRPFFIPEGKTVNGLLHDFQENRLQIAMVVNEYGGVSGLVTLEDILEHLFEEEHIDCKSLGSDCEILDEKTIIVSGNMPMDQFNSVMRVELAHDEFDTIGGFVLHLFGRLPVKGEEINCENFKFRIESMGRSRILKIRVITREEQLQEI